MGTRKKIPCSGIILSGGKNKRFCGNNKAFSKIGNSRIIDRIYHIFTKIFDNIIIVTNDPVAYFDFDCCIVTDHYTVRSSLNGIHAGLFASPTKYSFFIACDTPFASKKIIKCIINEIETNKDVIIPKTSLGLEPLFAIYSKNCLKPIANQIELGNLQISKLFNIVKTKKINEVKLKKEDPNLTSFFNVNNNDDLIEANRRFKFLPYL